MSDDMYYKLSKYYDLYSSENNYFNCSQFLTTIFRESDVKNVLDVGCGSGEVVSMLGNNFSVLGIDKSPFQIKSAKSKYPSRKFLCCDFLKENFSEHFDAVVFVWNTILYFCPEKNLLLALKKVYSLLSPRGVILFDFSAFLDYHMQGNFKKEMIRRRAKDNLIMELVSINVPNLDKRYYTETTISKIYKNQRLILEHANKPIKLNLLSLDRVKTLMEKCGFNVLEILSNKSLKEGKKIPLDCSNNYLIIARKI